jgi:hypothetical protein
MPGLMWPHLRHPREVGAMVEAQAGRWRLKQHRRWDPVVGTWPVVTISREIGDQGPALGRSLAERLGFSYWDRELVVELARLLNADNATDIALDERTRDAIEAFLGNSVPNQRVISADYTDRIRLVFDSIARRGGAVVVGQGAHFLVAPRQALRVHLVAPFGVRPLGQEVGDPADFDVVVNAGSYERERAASLVLMAYLAKFGDWPMNALSLAHRRETRLAPLLLSHDSAMPRTPSGLMDEETVQHQPKFRDSVKTVVKLA